MAAPLTREATCEPATPVLTPITEAPNVITSAIDVASPAGTELAPTQQRCLVTCPLRDVTWLQLRE